MLLAVREGKLCGGVRHLETHGTAVIVRLHFELWKPKQKRHRGVLMPDGAIRHYIQDVAAAPHHFPKTQILAAAAHHSLIYPGHEQQQTHHSPVMSALMRSSFFRWLVTSCSATSMYMPAFRVRYASSTCSEFFVSD